VVDIIPLSTGSMNSCSSDALPSVQRYSRLLMYQGIGYPLYCPEPNSKAEKRYREDGVSIGDVGQVIFVGEFDVTFNIYQSPGLTDLSTSMKFINLHANYQIGEKDIVPGTVYFSQGVNCDHLPQRNL